MADVLADEVVARRDDDVARAAVAHPLQDLAHAQRDGGLAGARGAGEAHVEGRHRRLEAELQAHLVDDEERGDLAHTLLHRLEADEVVVELLEDLLHALLVHEVLDGARLRLVRDVREQRHLAQALGARALDRLLAGGDRLELDAALDVSLLESVGEAAVVARLRGVALARRLDAALGAGLHGDGRRAAHRRDAERRAVERERKLAKGELQFTGRVPGQWGGVSGRGAR